MGHPEKPLTDAQQAEGKARRDLLGARITCFEAENETGSVDALPSGQRLIIALREVGS